MSSLARRIWTWFFTAVLFFASPTTGAQEPKTFILDTSFEFKSSATMLSRGYFYWNPPFVGGARLALFGNGQLMVTRTAAEPGRSGLMRLNADGSVDESFAPEIAEGALFAVAVDWDANVYAAIRGGGSNAVIKLNRKGERIWARQVEPEYSAIAKMVVRRDGTVLVCGSFTNIAGVDRNSVALLSARGVVREDFDPGLDGTATCAVENGDGSVFVGGDFERVKGELKMRLVKVRPDGSVDEGFDPGTALTEEVTAIGVDGDGRVVVSGHFNPGNGARATRLLRLLPDGSFDAEFETGAGLDGAAAAIAFDDAGRVVLAGAFTRVNGMLRPRIARLLEGGGLDETYQPGIGLNDTATDLVIDEAGKYLVTGYFGKVGHRAVPGLARLLNHSDLQTADFTDAIYWRNEQNNTAINLQRFGDSAGELVARVSLLPGNDPELSEFAPFETEAVFGPGQTFKVVSIPLMDDGWVEAPEYVALRCVVPAAGMESWARIGVVDNEEPVTFERKFSALKVVFVEPVAAAQGGKVAVGGILGFGVSTHFHPSGVVVFDEDGVVDEKFGFVMVEGNQELRVRAVDWTADGKLLIGGYFSHVRNAARNNLARLNADGTLDTTFRADVPAVFHMAALPDGKILTAPGVGSSLMRLLPTGQMDTSFQPEVTGFIQKMAVQPDGKILLHGEWLSLARLLPDGKKDPEFTSPFESSVRLAEIAVSKDGKIYVTGDFLKVQGLDRPGLVRLMPNGAVDVGFEPGGYYNSRLVLKEDGKAVAGWGGGLVMLNDDGSRVGDFTWAPQSYRPTQPLVELSDGKVLVNVEWAGGEFMGLQILQLTNKAVGRLVVNTVNLVLKEGMRRQGFEVKRIGDVSKELTAVLSIEDTSAEDIFVSGEVKFAALQTQATIDVGAVADGMIEEDEVHRVMVSGGNLVGSDFEVVVLDGNGRPGSAVVDASAQTIENGYALAPIDDDAVVLAQGRPPFLLKIDRSKGTKEVFNPLEDFNYAPRSIVAAGDKVLVGGLQFMPGPHVGRLVRLNRDGSRDTTFKEPDLHLNPAFVLPQADGKILVAGEFQGGENIVYNYALLNSDGTIARKYPNIQPPYHKPAVVNGKLFYHVRTSEHSGTVDRVYMLDLESGTQVGGTFHVDGLVQGIVAAGESALVYGAISRIGGLPLNGIARIKNGALDPTFQPEILPKEVIEALVDKEGRILILGTFRQVNGVEVDGLARLLPDGSLDSGFKTSGGLPPQHQIFFHSIVQLGDGNYAAMGNTPGYSNRGLVWINNNLPFAGRFARRVGTSSLNLVFNSEPGKRYEIEGSSDFSAWESIVETNALGFEIWLDPPSHSGMKFYRAKERN